MGENIEHEAIKVISWEEISKSIDNYPPYDMRPHKMVKYGDEVILWLEIDD